MRRREGRTEDDWAVGTEGRGREQECCSGHLSSFSQVQIPRGGSLRTANPPRGAL